LFQEMSAAHTYGQERVTSKLYSRQNANTTSRLSLKYHYYH